MAKTVPVYVSVNTDNNTLTDQPKSTAADGLTEMWIRPGMLNYLLENWQKYVVIDGEFKATSDNFADLSVDHLLHEIEVLKSLLAGANATIEKQDKSLTTLQKDNSSLKSANELTQQGLMEAVDFFSAQLPATSATTATTASAGSEEDPASSAAGEVK